MGDRGNIKVGDIYLYTHWEGSDIENILRRALSKKWRWNDEAYLTRIIFCEMIKDDVEGETGYGISTHMPDNEHDILFVDVENQMVELQSPGGHTIDKWTFLEFIGEEMD